MTDSPVQTDTTEMDLIPPGATAQEQVSDNAVLQVTKLAEFLVETFPDEIDLTNRQQPETPVDTVIRLLRPMGAKTPFHSCLTEFCNKWRGHTDEHGWVHNG